MRKELPLALRGREAEGAAENHHRCSWVLQDQGHDPKVTWKLPMSHVHSPEVHTRPRLPVAAAGSTAVVRLLSGTCPCPSLPGATGWGSEHLNSRLPASGKQRQPRGGEKGLRGDGAEPTLTPRNTIRPSGGGRSGFGGRAPELQPRLSTCPVWDQLSQSQRFDFKQATSRLSPEPQRSGAVAPWKPAPAVWTALLMPEHGRPGGSARRCAEGSPRDG